MADDRSQGGRGREAGTAVPVIRGLSRSRPIPSAPGVHGVLITADRLRRRVAELGRAIARQQDGGELVIVALLSGSVLFLADLIRQLDLPLEIDFLRVSSYRDGTVAGRLEFGPGLERELRGRDILVVDDILDSGQTLAAVCDRIRQHRPRRVRTCVLLDKPAGRRKAVEADFVGFRIPDAFVVGYGLDYAERYRNLPYIGVLTPGDGTGPT